MASCVSFVLVRYFHLSTFFWMFIEGKLQKKRTKTTQNCLILCPKFIDSFYVIFQRCVGVKKPAQAFSQPSHVQLVWGALSLLGRLVVLRTLMLRDCDLCHIVSSSYLAIFHRVLQ